MRQEFQKVSKKFNQIHGECHAQIFGHQALLSAVKETIPYKFSLKKDKLSLNFFDGALPQLGLDYNYYS